MVVLSSGSDHAGVSVDPDSMVVPSSGNECGSVGVVPLIVWHDCAGMVVPTSGNDHGSERGSVGVA